MKKIKLFSLLILFIATVKLNAQDQTISMFELRYDPVTVQKENAADTLVKLVCILTLNDTINLAKVFVKVGLKPGGNEMFENSYDFDFDKKNPDQKAKYRREGNKLYIDAGTYFHQDFYLTAFTKDKSDKSSATAEWRK